MNALKAHDKRAPEEIEASIDALQEEGKCASCAGELLSLKKDANSALDAFNRAHMWYVLIRRLLVLLVSPEAQLH